MTASRSSSSRVKLGLGLAAIVALVVAASVLPVGELLLGLATSIQSAGAVGIVGYYLLYVVATVFLVPAFILTLTAGFAWGPVVGTLVVWVSATSAATAAFLVGRFLARDWVSERAAQSDRFAAIDRAVGHNGFRIVLLLRLSPVFPFNLMNYILGVTQVKLRDYVAASALGMLPATAMYVYLGSLINNVTELASGERPDGGLAQTLLFWGGLVATVTATVFITRVARAALKQDLERAASAEPNAEARGEP